MFVCKAGLEHLQFAIGSSGATGSRQASSAIFLHAWPLCCSLRFCCGRAGVYTLLRPAMDFHCGPALLTSPSPQHQADPFLKARRFESKHANHQEGVPPRTRARTLSLVLVGLTSNVYLQGWASPLPGRDRFLRRRWAAAGEQRYMPACLASSL